MLFHIIMLDVLHSFVQKICGTELDIVYLTAAFKLNLLNKVIYSIWMYSYDQKRWFCMDVCT